MGCDEKSKNRRSRRATAILRPVSESTMKELYNGTRIRSID